MHQCVRGGWLCHCPISLTLFSAPWLSLFITTCTVFVLQLYLVFVLCLSPVPWFSLCRAFSYISISRPRAHCCSAITAELILFTFQSEGRRVIGSAVKSYVMLVLPHELQSCIVLRSCVAQSIERYPSVGAWQMAQLVKDIPNVYSFLQISATYTPPCEKYK